MTSRIVGAQLAFALAISLVLAGNFVQLGWLAFVLDIISSMMLVYWAFVHNRPGFWICCVCLVMIVGVNAYLHINLY